ncbi:hypothetical protein KAR91_15645, partial [Candidatus Pacearchaeota archaeon]|nr:hypothetical protein [Candidatus Pacearchaeota archaeon]
PWYKVLLRRLKLVATRTTEDVDVAITHYGDTSTSGTALTVLALDGGSNRITRATQNANILSWSHRFKFSVTTDNTTKGLRLIGWGMQYRIEREDVLASEDYNMMLAVYPVAFDSEDTRRSLEGTMPVPDGTIGEEDRRHIAGFFCSIDIAENTEKVLNSNDTYIIVIQEVWS